MPSFDSLRNKSTILITCPKGLSGYLRNELEPIAFPITGEYASGISIRGSFDDCMMLNLKLSTAHHVLFLLKECTCTSADELYKTVRTIDWENIIPLDGYVCVTSVVHTSSITDSRYANVRCKDAIVDRLVNKTGKRCNSGNERNKTVVFLYWVDNRLCLYIDTSGEPLSKRGYRIIPGSAPMQETLAAGVIAATQWKGTENFVNPMCGSGTIAIEAALKALNKAPGLTRSNFGFMHCLSFDPGAFGQLRKKLEEMQHTECPSKIIATDHSTEAIAAAQHNASIAGVEQCIEFSVCDFNETSLPIGKGIIILNPEYGYRMGEIDTLKLLYRDIGNFFKNKCRGYTGFVFTGNFDLAKFVGLKAKRKYPFLSGKIDCRLYEYELYEGSRPN